MKTAPAGRTPSPTGVWAQASHAGVEVSCPWNPDFVDTAKELGGRWNPETRTWRFHEAAAPQVRLLLTELFLTDGSPAPGVDILLALDDFYDPALPAPAVVEIGGRWAVAPRHGALGDYGLDTFTEVAHGTLSVENGRLAWEPGTVLHISCLPQTAVDSLPAAARRAVRILRRHGLDVTVLRRRQDILERELEELRGVIRREEEQSATHPLDKTSLDETWRLRIRDCGPGHRRLIIHQDGCMATPPPRTLTDREVADLVSRGAHLCNTCGAAARGRKLPAPPDPDSPALPHTRSAPRKARR